MEDRVQSEGMIYINDYKTKSSQPSWTGNVVVQKELVKQLVEKLKSGEEAVMRVALWDRVSKKGNEYKFARFDVSDREEPKKPRPTQEYARPTQEYEEMPTLVSEDEVSVDEITIDEVSDDDIPF